MPPPPVPVPGPASALALLTACALAALAACAHGGPSRLPVGLDAGLAVQDARVAADPADGYPFATAPLGLLGLLGPAASARRRASGIDDIDVQIVGGQDAQPKQFPHQASMQVVMPGFLWYDADPQHICGGTLVAAGWVLTAAHCVYGVPRSTVRVEAVLGISDLYDEGSGVQRIAVEHMFSHEAYNPSANGGVGPNDIALLKLQRAAELNEWVALAALPAADEVPADGSAATLSGWGSTSEDGKFPIMPERLQTAVFPVVAFDECYRYISKANPRQKNPLVDTNVCVGPLDKTGLSSCSGDSGGPLVQDRDGATTVIGVVSWGLKNCASFPFPSVFTRTSAFVDWIKSRIESGQSIH